VILFKEDAISGRAHNEEKEMMLYYGLREKWHQTIGFGG